MEEPTDELDIALTPNPAEIPSKLTLNKNGKPRKQLSPEALEKLAKARQRANAIRKDVSIQKLEEKVEKMKVGTPQDIAGNQMETITEPQQDIGGNEIEEPEVKVEKIKKKSKKKPQIIIEQSSDDDDEFQENDRVIFVKRVSRKKKEKESEPVPPPVMRQEPPPDIPDVPKPKPNPLQRHYDAMFSGQFLSQPRRR
jgi:hypothetical protein